MRLLAIDPGSKYLGWAHLQDRTVIMVSTLTLPDTKKRSDIYTNDAQTYLYLDYFMRLQLDGIILPGCMKPTVPNVIVIESYFTQNYRGTVVIPEIRSIIKLNAYKYNLPVVEVAPGQVKKYISGNGSATKEDVRAAVLSMYTSSPIVNDSLDDNAIDAIAIGLTGLYKLNSREDNTDDN